MYFFTCSACELFSGCLFGTTFYTFYFNNSVTWVNFHLIGREASSQFGSISPGAGLALARMA